MRFPDTATVCLAVTHMTWEQMLARTAAGQLPAMSALLARGIHAKVAPPADDAHPGLWATVASGHAPDRHGIDCRDEIWAGGFRPAGRQSWRAMPFWEILEAAKISALSVGWPHIAPGAHWPGTQTDDRLAEPTGKTAAEWLMPREVVNDRFRDALRHIRVHPTDISAAILRPFVPRLQEVDQYRDKRLVDLALPIARFSTDYAAWTTLADLVRPQVAAIHVRLLSDLLARFEHADTPFDAVIDSAWSLVDQMIGQIAQSLSPRATLILFSPGRTGQVGVMAAAGPGLPEGQEMSPISLLDFCPSLLARFGLESRELPGAARLNAPKTLREVPADRSAEQTPATDEADLQRVLQFGFTPLQPDPNVHSAHLVAKADALLTRNPSAARRLAEQALEIDAHSPAAIGILAAAMAALNDFSQFEALADRLDAISPGHRWVHLIRAGHFAHLGNAEAAAPLLRQAEEQGGPLEWVRAAAAWMMLHQLGEAHRLFAKLREGQPDSLTALIGMGLTSEGDPAAAEGFFREALQLDPKNSFVQQHLQEARLKRMVRS